jgi:nucleotide-binding universal stress UspA family protein
MYSTLIVPLDGSAFAERAIGLAVFLSKRGHTALLLARVHEGGTKPGYQTPAWEEFFRDEEEAYLEAVAARIQSEFSGTVDWALLDGSVVAAICARVDAAPSPLVVMSTHGRTGIRRAWMGNVASGLLRHSSAPVLMLRPQGETKVTDGASADGPFANVIVALDGSTFAEQVIPHAASIATASNARLLFIRVVDPAAPSDAAFRQAGAYMENIASLVDYEGSMSDARIEMHSSPGAAILACAAALERPLIAMASHGRGLSRLFLGSVADEVVRGSPRAVLMVRPRT